MSRSRRSHPEGSGVRNGTRRTQARSLPKLDFLHLLGPVDEANLRVRSLRVRPMPRDAEVTIMTIHVLPTKCYACGAQANQSIPGQGLGGA